MTVYENINNLEEIAFVAGTTYVMDFVIYDGDTGVPLNTAGASAKWVMAHYGIPEVKVLQKTAVATGDPALGVFTVSLTKSDTYDGTGAVDLYGKFVHQLRVIDSSGDYFRPAQGIITIIRAIPVT
jgi:hypothetical protein